MWTPSACSSAWMRGAPYVPCDPVWIVRMRRVRSTSAAARAEAGRLRQAIIAGRRDLQDASHRANGIHGLAHAHEPENPVGVALLSRANQAAAFARISRSCRRRWFSRRRRVSSSRSTRVGPSARLPGSRSACFTQVDIDCAAGSNSRDSSSRRASGSDKFDHLPPELRRISGSVTRHGTPQNLKSKVSTKPGQLQPAIGLKLIADHRHHLDDHGHRHISAPVGKV